MGAHGSRGRSRDHSALLTALGVDIGAELLDLALTHRSYAYENGGLPPNERLEFLGDAVLGLVITDHLYRQHPDLPEGQLAKLRASVVNMHALAGVARELGEGGLGAHLLLGKGEELTGGRDKASILADGLEAVIGAVYLQHGVETARQTVHRMFDVLLAEAPLRGAGLDWKTSLQELTAAAGLGVPEYRVAEEGPDHRKEFTATVIIGGQGMGTGVGRTKKEAEQRSAETAWRLLSDQLRTAAEEIGESQDAESGAAQQEGAAETGLASDFEAGLAKAAEGSTADVDQPDTAPEKT
ncbi:MULTISPECIES: ribonuclease III [Actinoalloteichus]|uniref:Ribonuclease 3 n=1 Tax=Actinoalloteichus fjordicus TaxID=1612552 RepID=A0AAC9LIT4_9PSEU|nr:MULTISPECIES: ribonuclease III [Actinoalloteichus]APU17125.1 ribonuclease III [Actinoalloteichus fjordicus]APU23207.1 ribonuclease III [Actinoalloteichus sp. GBA129-24]